MGCTFKEEASWIQNDPARVSQPSNKPVSFFDACESVVRIARSAFVID